MVNWVFLIRKSQRPNFLCDYEFLGKSTPGANSYKPDVN